MNDGIAELKKRLPSLEECAGEALIDKKSEYAAPCPSCGGDDRFFWKKGSNKGHCRQCGKSFDNIDIATTQTGKTISELMGEHGISSSQKAAKPVNGKIAYAWDKAAASHPDIDRYFSARNIIFNEDFPLPPSIRYSKWKDKKTGEAVCSILCAVSTLGDKSIQASQRTFLTEDCERKIRIMKGECKGRGVWFYRERAEKEGSLIIGEGAETVLSAMQATGINGVAGLDAGKMLAITLPGNVTEVFILVDEDTNFTGQKASIALAQRLEGEDVAAWLVTPTDKTFTDEPGKLDFNDLGPDQIKERFSARQRLAGINWTAPAAVPVQSNLDQPMPLTKKNNASEPFPFASMGEVMKNACLVLQDGLQAPDGIIALSVLGGANLAVQGLRNVIIDGRVSPVSLNLLSIAATGERKSAVDSVVLARHREIEKGDISRLAGEQGLYELSAAAFEHTKSSILKGKGALPEKQQQLESLMAESPAKPLDQTILVTDFTFEALYKLFQVGVPCKGLFADEGGQVTGGHSMKTESKVATAAGLSKFWDGARVDRIRVIDGSSHLYGRRLSVHLMMQEDVGIKFYTDDILKDQGLISRFLVAWPTSTVGQRGYRPVNAAESPGMQQYYQHVAAAMSTPLSYAEDSNNQELDPPLMTLSPEAKSLWVEAYNAIESESGPKLTLAPIRGLANKAAEHAARIAATIQLFEDPSSNEIKAEAMQQGVDLISWFLDEALRIAGAFNPDSKHRRAREVLRWIHDNNFDTVCMPDIYQFSPVRSAGVARHVVQMLISHNHLIEPDHRDKQPAKTKNGGWSKEWYQLHPESKKYFDHGDD